MNKLTKTIGIGALVLAGCRDRSNDFVYHGKVDRYDAVVAIDGGGREIVLNDGDNYVSANDRYPIDGRFDKIIIYLPKDHPLEKYANLQELEKAYHKLRGEYLTIQGERK